MELPKKSVDLASNKRDLVGDGSASYQWKLWLAGTHTDKLLENGWWTAVGWTGSLGCWASPLLEWFQPQEPAAGNWANTSTVLKKTSQKWGWRTWKCKKNWILGTRIMGISHFSGCTNVARCVRPVSALGMCPPVLWKLHPKSSSLRQPVPIALVTILNINRWTMCLSKPVAIVGVNSG